MSRNTGNAFIEPDRYCMPPKEINILLLGPTGVGKTTFINGLANYICNDTLDEAVNDKMQTIIPSSFAFTDNDTNEHRMITMGESNEHENFNEIGQSCTQQCRSFVFPVGKRNLRIIDAPGIGDTRGLELDARNFNETLNYISQYEHLNGICILLKPNEERLTILFRFCINELLRHLHTSASENIIFIFTNSRATFFMPGSSKRNLQLLLDQHEKDYQVKVPFSKDNTFLIDNEPFRYLALRQNGIQLNNEQTLSYQTSWDRTVKEYSRLMSHVAKLPLHAVRDTLSLNEAEQLIRKLTRPIAETATLIERNIQLAQQHKKNVLENPEVANEGIPQNNATILKLRYPRTVCVSKNCCRVINVNNEQKVEYTSKCHEKCYLIGVEQETINDPRMQDCEAIDYKTGKCSICGCSWKRHQHITYEYKTNLTRLDGKTSLSDIDKQISDLRDEKNQIENVYKQLAKFLHANAILPLNDDIIEYLRHFLQEEEMKRNSGGQNNDVIQSLEQMINEYTKEMELFKKTIQNEKDRPNSRDVLQPGDIFPLVGTLYRLPINGEKIREQVNGLKINQTNIGRDREIYVRLPAKANDSNVMREFKGFVKEQ